MIMVGRIHMIIAWNIYLGKRNHLDCNTEHYQYSVMLRGLSQSTVMTQLFQDDVYNDIQICIAKRLYPRLLYPSTDEQEAVQPIHPNI